MQAGRFVAPIRRTIGDAVMQGDIASLRLVREAAMMRSRFGSVVEACTRSARSSRSPSSERSSCFTASRSDLHERSPARSRTSWSKSSTSDAHQHRTEDVPGGAGAPLQNMPRMEMRLRPIGKPRAFTFYAGAARFRRRTHPGFEATAAGGGGGGGGGERHGRGGGGGVGTDRPFLLTRSFEEARRFLHTHLDRRRRPGRRDKGDSSWPAFRSLRPA